MDQNFVSCHFMVAVGARICFHICITHKSEAIKWNGSNYTGAVGFPQSGDS